MLGAPLHFLQVSPTQDFSHDPRKKKSSESDQVNQLAMEQDPLFLSTFQEYLPKVLTRIMLRMSWGSIMLKPYTLMNNKWDMFK